LTANIERIATPDEHSDIVGGSSAARVMGCPASVGMMARIPKEITEASSEYADEGTKLHEVMAYIINNDVPIMELTADPGLDELWTKLELDDELFFEAVMPAYRAFDDYCASCWPRLTTPRPSCASLSKRVAPCRGSRAPSARPTC
jgi:hypothetical protein